MAKARIRLDRLAGVIATALVLVLVITHLAGPSFWLSIPGIAAFLGIVGVSVIASFVRGGTSLRPLFRLLAGLLAAAFAVAAALLSFVAVEANGEPGIFLLAVGLFVCALYAAFCTLRGRAPEFPRLWR